MRFRGPLIALLTATVMSGCGNLFDPAAAVVDGTKITVDAIENELAKFRDTTRYDQLTAQAPVPAIERDFQQTYLSLLIREEVLESEAEERGLEVTPDEVNETIEGYKEDLGSEGQFLEALKEEGLTLSRLELEVRTDLLEEELLAKITADAGPTEDELRAYYEENIEDYQEVRVSHILVAEPRLAEKISAELGAAKESKVDERFAALAAKHSEDPSSADRGGELGWAPPTGHPDAFREAVAAMDVGEISDPVQTEFGFHVIRLTGRRVTPFEEVRDEIDEIVGGEAREEAFQSWLVDAYSEADIRVNSKFGELDVDTQLVQNPTADDVPGGEAPEPAEPTAS
ncbi:MAG: peptidyl-prolyl cis-trans isomerase [Actinomycetota bacterium]|nr:peptidyl-prolyl cis-trans isomerase [Actinomycetota bacterium]